MNGLDGLPMLLGLTIGFAVCVQTGSWLAERWRYRRRSEEEFQLRRSLLNEELAIARARRLEAETKHFGWKGFRRFIVNAKVPEASGVVSLYLTPQDGRPLPSFAPGQFVTVRVRQEDGTYLSRCYSLSDRSRPEYYRITVKRIEGETGTSPGRMSNWIHDHLRDGDCVELQAPQGEFCFDPHEARPAILIGAGIGVTPIYAMASQAVRSGSRRQLIVFLGMRDGRHHVFRRSFAELSRESRYLQVVTCYSRPTADDRLGHDYDVPERVSIRLLRELLPSSNYDFYLCGPSAAMQELLTGLREWGVPESSLHFESFGPSSGKSREDQSGDTSAVATIRFETSDMQAMARQGETLLEVAERAGVPIASNCRQGNCGTCVIRLKAGAVQYASPPSAELKPGECLACVAQPRGSVAVDA